MRILDLANSAKAYMHKSVAKVVKLEWADGFAK